MKRTKKQLSLVLVLVMALTVLNGYAAKANATITVTLRVEQDEKTLIPPVEVTLTEADKKSYGIGLSTETLTPLHALAKYLSVTKNASDETMKNFIQASESQYGLFLEGINTDGSSSGSPAAGSQDGVSWMFAVNNTSPNVGVSAYELKDCESVVLYGIWGGGTWPDLAETNYSYWEQDSYSAAVGTPLTVRLKGLGYDENYNSIIKDIAGASVIAAPYSEKEGSVTESTASIIGATDESGTASLTFTKAGTYTLSAYRKAEDGTHYDISRPYAVVTVSDVPSATATPAQTQAPSPTPGTTVTTPRPCDGILPPRIIQKPSYPTSLKATVKKGTSKKKTIQLSWKKAKYAKGYRVYISKKKNKGYKKLADTKKTKLKFKRKKGTYYIRIKAYNIINKKRVYGRFSKTKKIIIKG